MRQLVAGMIGVMVTLAPLSAQQPTCKMCPGTYIPNSEVMAYVKRHARCVSSIQQIRAVDIGKINLDSRRRLSRQAGSQPAPQSVAEHDQVSERTTSSMEPRTLMLGPDITEMKRRPADLETVRLFNGPGNNGASIRNGVSYDLKPGDVVIIPAGTGHWFTKIDDHIYYLMVRLDPDKVTPNKSEADSKAYLSTKPTGKPPQ